MPLTALVPSTRSTAPGDEADDIASGLRSLVQTYLSYLSGCDACAIESIRAARAANDDPTRLRLLSSWRRAPMRTYTERERTALVWAEVLAVSGEEGIGEDLRRRGNELFGPAALAALTRIVVATRAYKRLMLERSGELSDRRRHRENIAITADDGCRSCAAK